jgi:hypothetical protein
MGGRLALDVSDLHDTTDCEEGGLVLRFVGLLPERNDQNGINGGDIRQRQLRLVLSPIRGT